MHRYGLTENILMSIVVLAEQCNVKRIVLFGSRARGDFKERSDIDLAVYGGNADHFCANIDDFVPTLLKFDIVCMERPVQKELIESIKREGVVLYEKI